MQTFSVVTTWGEQHWDLYAKRSVQSIIDNWPKDTQKFFIPTTSINKLKQKIHHTLV